MAGGGLTSIGDIKNAIESAVGAALKEYAPLAQEQFALYGTTDVYDVYEPFVYSRSKSLEQPSTYEATFEGNTSVTFSVNHPHAELIEYGEGEGGHYEYPYNRNNTAYKFLSPRPYFSHGAEAIKETFRSTLWGLLEAQGLKVEG